MNLSFDFNFSRLQSFIFYINHFYVALQLAGTEQSMLELDLKGESKYRASIPDKWK